MVQLGTCLTYTTASVAKFFMGICLLCIGDREFLDIYSYFGSSKPPKIGPKYKNLFNFSDFSKAKSFAKPHKIRYIQKYVL